jgi:hypothetical protein
VKYIEYRWVTPRMASTKLKGLTQSSNLIVIGARVTETAPNTFSQHGVDLQLNPLDNEVFVVQAINLEPGSPEGIPNTDTSVDMTITTTSQTTLPSIDSSNVIGNSLKQIRGANYLDSGVPFQSTSMDTPPSDLSYLAIIATNDFFIQIQGVGNTGAKVGKCKVYGYRARADASVYAALVQSEVLSS